MRIWIFIDYNILVVFSDAGYHESACFLLQTVAS